jgi:hypothetical protein
VSFSQVAPGVKIGLNATLPDTQSGKLLVDYVNKQIHVKSSVGLTTSPKVTLSAASGYKNLVFGAEGAYDTAKSVVSNYGLALGLHAGDSQLAVHLQVRRHEGPGFVAFGVFRVCGLGVCRVYRIGLRRVYSCRGLVVLMGSQGNSPANRVLTQGLALQYVVSDSGCLAVLPSTKSVSMWLPCRAATNPTVSTYGCLAALPPAQLIEVWLPCCVCSLYRTSWRP